MADKDYETYFKRLCPLFDRIIVTEASNPRKAGVRELYDYAVQYCGNVSKCADPFEAVLLAKRGLKSGDALLVCGSLYLAGDVRDFLINTFKDMQ